MPPRHSATLIRAQGLRRVNSWLVKRYFTNLLTGTTTHATIAENAKMNCYYYISMDNTHNCCNQSHFISHHSSIEEIWAAMKNLEQLITQNDRFLDSTKTRPPKKQGLIARKAKEIFSVATYGSLTLTLPNNEFVCHV